MTTAHVIDLHDAGLRARYLIVRTDFANDIRGNEPTIDEANARIALLAKGYPYSRSVYEYIDTWDERGVVVETRTSSGFPVGKKWRAA